MKKICTCVLLSTSLVCSSNAFCVFGNHPTYQEDEARKEQERIDRIIKEERERLERIREEERIERERQQKQR